MKFVTSISPHRIERQQHCIASWLKYDLSVTAVQFPHEVDTLKPYFPEVRFVPTESKDDYFGSKCPRIYPLIRECYPGILINADIELAYTPEDFIKRFITPPSKQAIIAIRWDVSPDDMILNRYGLDVFRIYPEHHQYLSDKRFVIGQPGWDYWITLAFRRFRVFTVFLKDQEVLHEVHDDRYIPENITKAHKLLTKEFNTNPRTTTRTILQITGRA